MPRGLRRLGWPLLILAAYAALVAVYFHPVAFGGRSLLTSPVNPGALPSGPYGVQPETLGKVSKHRRPVIDPGSSAWTAEPWTALIAQLYAEGEVPLWNPYSGLGMPLAGNMQSGAFFPLRLPLFIAPSAAMWNAYLLGRFLVMGASMYGFLRLWSLGRLAAFAGGVAFAFTGHFVLHANMWHLDVEMLLPLLLVAVEVMIRARTWSAAAGLGVALAVSVTGGSPESSFFLCLFVVAYFVFRVARIARRSGHWLGAVGAYTPGFALAVGLALVIAAPLLLLFLEYLVAADVPAHRAGGHTGLAANPWSGAVSLIVPYLFDQFSYVRPIVPSLHGHLVTPYLGVVPVALALLARVQPMTAFFGVYAVVSLLKAYGAPGINSIGALPLFERAWFLKYNQPVVAFCVAALLAWSLHGLATARGGPSARRVLATALALALTVAGFIAHHREAVTRTSGTAKWILLQTSTVAMVLLVLTLLLVVAVVWRRWAGVATVAVAVLLVAEMFLYVPKRLPPRMEAFRVPPFVEFLKTDGEAFRVYGLDGILYPNTSAAFRLDDVRALEAIYPARYLPLVRRSLDRTAADRFTEGSPDEVLGAQGLVDLMNVKYVVSWQPLDSLFGAVLRDGERQGPRENVSRAMYTIAGARKTLLFQHPPSQVTYAVRVPERGARLRFSLGMSPAVWQPSMGDGTVYRLRLLGGDGQTRTVFEAWIDPKNRPEDRRWHDGSVDLSPWRGQTVTLVFVAEPGGSPDYDWGGWGDLRLERPDLQESWEKVYDGELKIYRNHQALARAFVTHRAEVARSGQDALERVTAPGFDARRVVVLEEPLGDGHTVGLSPTGDAGSARVVEHRPHRVIIDARLEAPGFLVLSDTFYPGWTATVDGRAVKIYRANYLFRAVHLEVGSHRVEFRYRPAHFYVASVVSVLTLVGALALVWRGRRR